jgi:phage-related protein
MSSIISGLNIKNISEYNTGLSYNKFDIIDYQFITGISVYPSYTGFGNTGLCSWFNNDNLEDFATDGNFNVTGWINKVINSGGLSQLSLEDNIKPNVAFNEPYITLRNLEFLSGTGFEHTKRTIFLAVNASEPNKPETDKQKIIKFGPLDSPNGSLQILGKNSYFDAKLILDNVQFDAASPIYNETNIFTLIQDDSSTLKIRQNGLQIGQIVPNAQWDSSYFEIGNNPKNNGIKYYDLFYFSGILSETQIDYYEKYLFEKYFPESDGLFFAKKDVPVGEQYSPIFFEGKDYWTKNINDLFNFNYGSSANFTANLSPLKMGDGYKTNIVNTINTLNATFNLVYDGLTDAQAKCLIAFFENTPESPNKSLYEGFKGVNTNLFSPYKSNAELYFKKANFDSSYNNINKITIEAESLYDSSLDYKGMFVVLDENKIKTYKDSVDSLTTHDIFYYESFSFNDRGYYFYTGVNRNSTNVTGPVTGPVSGPFDKILISPSESPTGVNSFFTKDFYFKGDLEYDVDENVRLFPAELKNSTIEYSKDGINYNILEFSVSFNRRTNQEARAILKFLDDKAGFKVFYYTLPQPYNKKISVYCPEWNHTYNFSNNNDISVKFIEFKNPANPVALFNTQIRLI